MGSMPGNLLPRIDARLQRQTADREIVCDLRGPDGEKIRCIRGQKQTGKEFDEFLPGIEIVGCKCSTSSV